MIPESLKRKRIAISLALALSLGGTLGFSSGAEAAGLGKLTVMSGLGQPLRAEIEVNSATADEIASLQVRVASSDAFRQAGIEYNPDLAALRFSIDRQGNKPVVRVTSLQPINEPFVDILIELSWASGRLVREYTFLLDPPELRNSRAPESVAPAVSETLAPVPAAPIRQPVAPAPAPSARPVAPAPSVSTDAANYVVKPGDTLGKIASNVKPQGTSLDQMLVAMFRANPGAFAGNMNRLKAGAVLQVPQAGATTEVPDFEARKEVVAQTADFAAYRARLASGVSTASVGGERSASGTVTPKVEDKAAPKAESGDKVKLARPAEGKAVAGATGGGSARTADMDKAAAKEKALQEAKQRVAELERNVSDLNALVKNNAAATAQKNAELAKAAEAAKLKAAEEAKAAESARVAKAAEDARLAKAAEDAKLAKAAEAAKQAAALKVEEAAKAAAEIVKSKQTAPPKAEVPKAEPVAAATPDAKTAEPAKADAVKPAPVADADASSEGGMGSLLQDPKVLGGTGIALALLGAFALFNRYRKRKFERFQDSILTGGDLKSNSIFGTTGGQSVDTSDSTFNSNFTPSASQLDSNEVDPIAEADVYIAYGRDAQAEEILKEALKTSPDRQAIRVKLLEIYAARRDVPAFEVLAGELYSLTHGEGEDWHKAASLGRSLDPRNPLYGTEDLAPELAIGTDPNGPAENTAPEATVPLMAAEPDVNLEPVAVDFDIGPTAEEPTPLDFDLGLSSTVPPSVPVAGAKLESFGDFSNSEASGSVPSVDFDLNTSMHPDDAVPEIKRNVPARDFGLNEGGLALDVATVPEEELEQAEARARHAASLPPPELDLSDISLDLPEAEVGTAMPVMDAAAASAKQQEMATKLDLAAAYHEIGDREGAQELLDEVIRGGDQDQQERARKMLEALA
jgi:pilus assembly protein FimV